MCQLTLVNLHNSALNTFFATNQMLINSAKVHRDGFGFSSYTKFYKSKEIPQESPELNKELFEICETGGPIICHVRKATYTNNVKIVDEKFSHPFVGKRYILAHNGSLETRNLSEMSKHKDKIDSQVFLEYLEKNDKDGNIVESLPKTMAQFHGKFAFLIHDKILKTTYIARGFVADLYISYLTINGEKAGYVVNTNEDDLKLGIRVLPNFAYQLTKEENLVFTKPQILTRDSLFQAGDFDIQKIGDVEETYRPQPKKEETKSKNLIPSVKQHKEEKNQEEDVSSLLLRINDKLGLTWEELDTFFFSVNNAGILSNLDSELYSALQFLTSLVFHNHSHMKRKLWDKIQFELPEIHPIDIYENFGIQFPYFMAEKEELWDLYNNLKEANKNVQNID